MKTKEALQLTLRYMTAALLISGLTIIAIVALLKK